MDGFDEGPSLGGEVTLLLKEWGSGRNEAFRELLPLVYARLHALATASMRGGRGDATLQPTALVNELYVRLSTADPPDWNDRNHFYSFCVRTMRWILNDHTRFLLREKRRVDLLFPLTDDIPWLGERDHDALDLDRALSKLETLNPRQARVLELRVYLGCTAEETAVILNVSKPTVDRDLTFVRAWLCRELRPLAPAVAVGSDVRNSSTDC
jgi:RNA polymerase sigma factor (TIGR02999 family)